VPSYKSSQLCRFEQRRNNLAQLGRNLQQQIDCPLGKGVKLKKGC
jgi:hypothetical protein